MYKNYLSTAQKDEVTAKISSAQNIIISGHINPDGDCLGAALGVYNYLKSMNKNVTIFVPNEFPKYLKWLKGADNILVFNQEDTSHVELVLDAELIFCLDYNELKRCGDISNSLQVSSAYKIMIDHHPSPQDFCNLTVSDTAVSSASELVYCFLKQIDNNFINQDIAENLFVGIVMDTGCFQHNSSLPATFIIIAELLQSGINKDNIFNLLFKNSSENRVKLLGYLLNNKLFFLHDKKTAYIYFSKDEQQQFDYQIGDTESFVNIPLQIAYIEISAFIMESDNHVKISLRSKSYFDVNLLARQYFNGGGHKNAAGGKIYHSLSDTVRFFLNVINNTEI